MSSVSNGGPAKITAHRTETVPNYTLNHVESWVSLDLGTGRALRPDYYCLRNDSNSGHALRNWRLEGSRDGAAWVALRQHTNDASLSTTQMAQAAWPVEGAREFYRHFRVIQTGSNASGNHLLMCAGMELYGELRGPLGR